MEEQRAANTSMTGEQSAGATSQKAGGRLVVIFDGSCDFCTATAELLQRLDWRQRLQCLPFQMPGLPERYGLTLKECEESLWVIWPDGRRARGAEAVSAALDAISVLPLFRWLYRLPGLAGFEERLYRWVAAHRQYLPGVRPFCQRPGAPCGS
jgi:predicted DCC family thiol-disulfide oxidoreductase YuxK